MTDTILNIHTDFFNQQADTVYNTIEQELQLAMDRFLREHKLQQEFNNGNVWFENQVEILTCDKDGRIEGSEAYVEMPEYIGTRKDSDKDRFDDPDVEDIHSSTWHTKTERIFDWISWSYSNYPNATDVTVSIRGLYDDGSEHGCTIEWTGFVVEFKRETFKIVRFHFPNIDINEAEFIKGGLTREEAIAHCKREDSHEMWTWFDGWTAE